VISPSLIRAAHRQNLIVQAWTVNEAAAMRKLIAAGIDGIMTDYPGRLRRLMAQSDGNLPTIDAH